MTHFTLLLLLTLTGAAIGGIFAKLKGGKAFDIVHYMAIFGIFGLLLSAFLIVTLMRG
ncbi:MAG: hypothetical protein ACPGVK_00120 [Halocynthiibacter sp.]